LYAARVILITGAALTLRSWIALVPAALNAVLLVVRTLLEDRMLTTELPGYREYAKHVPERLVPGLW
jgi:protein-S-isoprenylcysteine O-methyltransferase Ste14